MNAFAESRRVLLRTAERIVQEIDPPRDATDGALIVRQAVLVVDVMHPDGGRQMYLVSSDPNGDALVAWATDGLLHYAIYDYQADDDDD